MRVSVAAVSLLLAMACGPLLPHPPYAAQPPEALREVDHPPPPARVEVVPPRPAPGAAWIDGEWTWRRGRWAWLRGRWVMPPAGAVFATWAFVRGADGRLWYAPGAWRDAKGAAIDPPPPLALADVQSGAVVNAEGEIETTGPVVRDRPPGAQSPAPP